MKHAQKMVIIPEHLLQSMETERRLTAPVQLPTLTRLDQDMKQIIVSFTRRPNVLMLDQLLQRYQGLTKHKTNENGVGDKTDCGPSQTRSFACYRDIRQNR